MALTATLYCDIVYFVNTRFFDKRTYQLKENVIEFYEYQVY